MQQEKESERLISLDRLDDVVSLLHVYGPNLVRYRDRISGNTALHYARNTDVAKLFVMTMSELERHNLLTALNEVEQSQLHAVIQIEGRAEVVAYLLSHNVVVEEMLLAKDWYGNTPLHYVQDIASATEIVRAALGKGLHIQELFYNRNQEGKTPLHTACENCKAEVVSYLLAQVELVYLGCILLETCSAGNTALHLAKDEATAGALLKSFENAHTYECGEIPEIRPYLNTRNKKWQTVMHTVSYMQESIGLVEKIMSLMESNFHDNRDETHYLLSEDIDGNTPLLLAVYHGQEETTNYILTHCPNNVLGKLLSHRNAEQQNVYHIASKHIRACKFLEILMEYSDEVDFCDVLMPDQHRNSPLHYQTGSYKVEAFSRNILPLPLPMRRLFVYSPNIMDADCSFMITKGEYSTSEALNDFFQRSVLNDQRQRSLHSFYGQTCMMKTWDWLLIRKSFKLQYDNRMKKVLCYALLEYPTDDGSRVGIFRVPRNDELQVSRDSIMVCVCTQDKVIFNMHSRKS